jgi:hypothetical protein
MDKIKEYIYTHKRKLDTPVPPNLWDGIEKRIQDTDSKRSTPLIILKGVLAACVIGLAGVGVYALLFTIGTKNEAINIVIKSPEPAISKTDTIVNRVIVENIKEPLRIAKKDTRKEKVIAQAKAHSPKILPDSTNLLQNIEKGYTLLVNAQIHKISTTPIFAEDPDYFNVFKKQLQDLNESEDILRQDIGFYGFNNDNLDMLISNYKQKINLLETLFNEIKKMNEIVPTPGKPKFLKLL